HVRWAGCGPCRGHGSARSRVSSGSRRTRCPRSSRWSTGWGCSRPAAAPLAAIPHAAIPLATIPLAAALLLGDLLPGGPRLGGMAGQFADDPDHLRGIERLGQVRVHADLLAAGLVVLLCPRGDEHDLDVLGL